MSSTTIAPPIPVGAPRTRLRDALLERVRSWSYYGTADAADRRDLRVDLLRGFCIFAMVVDHFGGDSWLYAITGGNRFYVSAAEGFIFISGFVMGQAYRSKRDRSGLPAAMAEALRRARTLYLATVALTLIFSLLYLYTDIALWTGRDFGLGIDSLQEIAVAVADAALHLPRHRHPGDVHAAAAGRAAGAAAAVGRRVVLGADPVVAVVAGLPGLSRRSVDPLVHPPRRELPAGGLAGAVRHRPRAGLLPRGADRLAAPLPSPAGGRSSRWASRSPWP